MNTINSNAINVTLIPVSGFAFSIFSTLTSLDKEKVKDLSSVYVPSKNLAESTSLL